MGFARWAGSPCHERAPHPALLRALWQSIRTWRFQDRELHLAVIRAGGGLQTQNQRALLGAARDSRVRRRAGRGRHEGAARIAQEEIDIAHIDPTRGRDRDALMLGHMDLSLVQRFAFDLRRETFAPSGLVQPRSIRAP